MPKRVNNIYVKNITFSNVFDKLKVGQKITIL